MKQNLDKPLMKLAGLQEAWNSLGVSVRSLKLRQWADAIEAQASDIAELRATEAGVSGEAASLDLHQAVSMIRYQASNAEERLQEEALPGPTGESNHLHTAGRGVVLCAAVQGSSLTAQAGQLAAALVAGNTVLLCARTDSHLVLQRLAKLAQEVGVEAVVCEAAEGLAAVSQAAPLAVLAQIAPPAEWRVLGRHLAVREGVLVQLVTDPGDLSVIGSPSYLLRFITERTRTINTTAVGGNASLLELGAGGH